MEIIQCSSSGWKIAFEEAPQYTIFQWGTKDCKIKFVEGISFCAPLKSKEGNIYYESSDLDFVVRARLLLILHDDFTPKELNFCFANRSWVDYYNYDAVYQSKIADVELDNVNSNLIRHFTFCPPSDLDFKIAPYATNCNVADGTNTCIKCGFDNPYIDPTPGYICRQCKMRNEAWA
jgi:hypothetical protein